MTVFAPATRPRWRSLLYVPGHTVVPSSDPGECRPDGVVVDLEHFVPEAEKPLARRRVPSLAAGFSKHGFSCLVRINRRLDQAVLDIQSSVGPNVSALVVSKVLSKSHLELLAEVVVASEAKNGLPDGHTSLIALIESAAALRDIHEIASAVPGRLVAMAVGGEDLAADCRMLSSETTLSYSKCVLVHAAAAAGLQPWGYLASVADDLDDARFRAMLHRSFQHGFRTATCIRAAQVNSVNDVYSSQPEGPF
jgi:citrate lyase subunit beta/citryl-CoA lyase